MHDDDGDDDDKEIYVSDQVEPKALANNRMQPPQEFQMFDCLKTGNCPFFPLMSTLNIEDALFWQQGWCYPPCSAVIFLALRNVVGLTLSSCFLMMAMMMMLALFVCCSQMLIWPM